MKLKAPYIPKENNWIKVREFVQSYTRAGIIPVDIERVITIDMEIEIVPESGLRNMGVDAYVTRDFQTIVVDADHYNDDKYYSRIKFSLAHELGHVVLHRDFFTANSGATEEWFDFMNRLSDDQYSLLEFHANEFAGVLLVPPDKLISAVKGGKTSLHELARTFEVSPQVIERRIQNDDVYPHLFQNE
jgi:Zn-dependent peptidase ImmA (M78 family)